MISLVDTALVSSLASRQTRVGLACWFALWARSVFRLLWTWSPSGPPDLLVFVCDHAKSLGGLVPGRGCSHWRGGEKRGARLELVAVFDDDERRVPVHLGKGTAD